MNGKVETTGHDKYYADRSRTADNILQLQTDSQCWSAGGFSIWSTRDNGEAIRILNLRRACLF